MTKSHWDLTRVLPFVGAVLGIILSLLPFFGLWYPFWSFLGYDWIATTIQVIPCGVILLGYGLLGWKTHIQSGPLRGRGKRSSCLFFLISGIVLLFVFGNLAGILFLIEGMMLPFGS